MNKKEIIIEKARELFQQYGYKKVSMDEIANKANVTKKTIYSYFKDKEELFKHFIQEELNLIKEEIENQEKNNLPFIEIVSNNIYSMLNYRRTSQLVKKMINSPDDKMKEFLKLYDDQVLNYIKEKLDNGIKNNQVRNCDTTLTSFIIYKIFLSIMFEYKKELDEKKVTQEITTILKIGLLK